MLLELTLPRCACYVIKVNTTAYDDLHTIFIGKITGSIVLVVLLTTDTRSQVERASVEATAARRNPNFGDNPAARVAIQ